MYQRTAAVVVRTGKDLDIAEVHKHGIRQQSGHESRDCLRRQSPRPARHGVRYGEDIRHTQSGPHIRGSPDNGIKVSQSFEFPTVYAARRKYLKAETAAAQSRLAVTRNEVIRNVSSYYYTLLHQRRTIEILQAQDSVYGRFVSLASAKRKAGETGNLELINAERIYNENRIEKEKAEKAYRSSMLAFRQLLNADVAVVPADASLSIIQQEMPETSVSFEQTPLGEMYAARMAASERNLSLTKQEFMPGLSIGLTGQLLIKASTPTTSSAADLTRGISWASKLA